MAEPFWEQPEAQEAIERIAAARSLTIVVGAGCATEVGLPTWSKLLTRLLVSVGRGAGAPDDSPGVSDGVTAFCDWTVQAAGAAGAGSIVQAHMGRERFIEEVRGALYEGMRSAPLPGPSALAVAGIRKLWGDSCQIATTNYDRLLEDALVNVGFKPRDILSMVDGSPVPRGRVAVRHLHGLLTSTGQKKGKIVLSEDDYHVMQDERSWQDQYFQRRLRESTCVFVGASLSDPNLLRYLYRTRRAARHEAILVRQGTEVPAGIRDGVRQAREHTARERWRALHINPIEPDYYVQSAQVTVQG